MEDAASDLERRWAIGGAGFLLLSFLFPLIANKAIFFTDLLDYPLPGVRLVVLVPAVLAVAAFAVALMTRGLLRATILLLIVGLAIIVWAATLEAWALAAYSVMSEAQALPVESAQSAGSGSTIFVYGLGFVVAAVGLALTRLRDDSPLGPSLAGLAGVVLLITHFLPMFGTTSLAAIIADGRLWSISWMVPLWAITSMAFAAACAALLIGSWDSEDLAVYARGLGWLALAAPAIGLVVNFPLAAAVSVVIKLYGGWIAIHVLLAAGLLGLVGQGLAPRAPL